MTSGTKIMQPLLYRFRAMNTDVELSLACDGYTMSEAVELAVDWYEEVERVFSRFRPDSELSRINRTAGSGAPVMISSMMRDVLQLTLWHRETTGGIFSPLVGDSMDAAGYDRSFEQLTAVGPHGTIQSADGSENNRCQPSNDKTLDWGHSSTSMLLDIGMQSVQLKHGSKLDLGGIAKGWATAKLVQWLRTRFNIRAGLVNAGGDLQAWNDCSDEPIWQIDIKGPIEGGGDNLYRMMREGAAATSGTLGRRWQTNRGIQHHLIDTRTCSPSRSDIVQCTVSGPDLITCEVWAKTICIAGEDGLRRMSSKLPSSYTALMINKAGGCRYCARDWLTSKNEGGSMSL
ncbi:hypothetical protein PCCS19_46180 [Paenibacillus sp. CCS19]|uniref:FAD:protein FMN transferase n=1 Tax=Paenibacillus sp. CCS19 TaxID=3158387 RepID=UPI002569A960|nr:FAD:protein FMN transferase [Paenibacillus cellulosilyticus]GMK41561.1 hypothetical protein PCCS19_46180 [Paenibacillus cellulosilyticus]